MLTLTLTGKVKAVRKLLTSSTPAEVNLRCGEGGESALLHPPLTIPPLTLTTP